MNKIIVYLNSPGLGRTGLNRPFVWAAPAFEDLGTHTALKVAQMKTLLRDIITNVFNRRPAIVYVGIAMGFMMATLPNMLASLALGRRIHLFWQEGPWVYDRLVNDRPWRAKLFNALIRNPNLIHLVISNKAKKFCESLGIRGSRIRVIGSCVPDPGSIDDLPDPYPQNGCMRVIGAGSIQARKGTDIFCEAAVSVCKERPDVEFHWFGDSAPFEPGYYESCLAMVHESGFGDRIIFHDFVDDPKPLYAHCHVFVMTSREEPLNLAALEVMSMRGTVVTFDTGGLAEIIGSCGHVIAEPDAGDLADKIAQLASLKREELRRDDARRLVLDHYTPLPFAKRVLDAVQCD